MEHLTEEQLDDLLQSGAPEPEHLQQCPICQARLNHQIAMRAWLRRAFNSVEPPDSLRRKIWESYRPKTAGTLAELESIPDSIETKQPKRIAYPFWKIYWRRLAAAAVILLLCSPLLLLFRTSSAEAGWEELVQIHQHNITPHEEFFSDDNPEKLADYFKTQLGFTPELPQLNQGMELRGCCIAHYHDKPVGSYVVNTPHGMVSVIVVKETPQEIGLTRLDNTAETASWIGTFPMCNMAAVRLGDYTYCAVGKVPHEALNKLLGYLIKSK